MNLTGFPKNAYCQMANNVELVMVPLFGPFGPWGGRCEEVLQGGNQPIPCTNGPKILVTRASDGAQAVIDAVDWDGSIYTNPQSWDCIRNVPRGPWTPPS